MESNGILNFYKFFYNIFMCLIFARVTEEFFVHIPFQNFLCELVVLDFLYSTVKFGLQMVPSFKKSFFVLFLLFF